MLINLLKNDSTPAVALLAIAISKYGTDCFQWEPEILRDTIKKDFGYSISDIQQDKISTAIEILTGDNFENNIQVFVVASHILNNNYASFDGKWENLEVEEAVCAISEATAIKEEKLKFCSDILIYLGHFIYEYGFYKAPSMFPDVKCSQFQEDKPEEADTEKNEAVKEIYDANITRIQAALKEIVGS